MAEIKEEICLKPKGSMYSGHQLFFYPKNPSFELDKRKQEEVVEMISLTYSSHEICSSLKDEVEFHTSGQGFESVICPNCRKKIDQEEWSLMMDQAYNSKFDNLNIITSCCQFKTTLNDLEYNDGAGFAKYSITIVNVEWDENLANELKIKLEQVLNTQLRLVWSNI